MRIMYIKKISISNWQYIERSNDDGTVSVIPLDPANTDYQAYLEWVAEGNTAEEWEG